MFLAAFILLILWAVAEIYLIVLVAGAIGLPLTILLLIAAWPLGRWATRRAGEPVWRRFNEAIAARRSPGREVVDGALVLLGGVLLIIPGFISDAVGLLLLVPITRAPARALLTRNLQSRVVVQAGRFGGGGTARTSYDVDGTAREVEPPQIRP
jgi:UPF0716 protein FxsA